MGKDGPDQSAEIARLLTEQAEQRARAADDTSLSPAWRWSGSGWSGAHERTLQSLDAESDPAKDSAKG